MGRPSPLRMVVRVVAALLVLGGGLVHLQLYNDGYKDFPNANLGRSFLLNVAASIAARRDARGVAALARDGRGPRRW